MSKTIKVHMSQRDNCSFHFDAHQSVSYLSRLQNSDLYKTELKSMLRATRESSKKDRAESSLWMAMLEHRKAECANGNMSGDGVQEIS